MQCRKTIFDDFVSIEIKPFFFNTLPNTLVVYIKLFNAT